MIKHIITRLIPFLIIVFIIYNFDELVRETSQGYLLLFISLIIYVVSLIWWVVDAIIKYYKNEPEKFVFNVILIVLPLVYWGYINYLGLYLYND